METRVWWVVLVHSKTEVRDWDALIPPIKELVGGGLSLWRLVLFKEVNDELVKFLVVETIVMIHPLCGIVEGEVKL